METKKPYNLHATSLAMMLENMTKHSNNNGPGQPQIMSDMKRLSDSVNALAILATDTDPEQTREQREARTMKAADKLGAILPTITERLEALKTATEAGFEQAFIQNSGLVQTDRASEIRAHLKSIPLNDRPSFIQALLTDNDNESLGAVIFAQPYLSGLDSLSHSRLKEQIEQTRLPELSVNREMFTELTGNLRVAIHTAAEAVKDFSNPRKLQDMEERSRMAQEAQERLDKATLPGV